MKSKKNLEIFIKIATTGKLQSSKKSLAARVMQVYLTLRRISQARGAVHTREHRARSHTLRPESLRNPSSYRCSGETWNVTCAAAAVVSHVAFTWHAWENRPSISWESKYLSVEARCAHRRGRTKGTAWIAVASHLMEAGRWPALTEADSPGCLGVAVKEVPL